MKIFIRYESLTLGTQKPHEERGPRHVVAELVGGVVHVFMARAGVLQFHREGMIRSILEATARCSMASAANHLTRLLLVLQLVESEFFGFLAGRITDGFTTRTRSHF